MQKILKEVLHEIKPSKKEEKRVAERIEKIKKKVQKALSEAKVVLGGSGEKGTWLKDAHDADLFVLFPKKYREKEEELSNIVEKKLKKHFSLTRLHGSRDYFQVVEKDFTFEIIPILEITKASQAMNITDVSPLHAKWVKKHKKYADEIRLTKQFFKSAKVYGAESYIKGFSGYVCEVLTISYKGFVPLLKKISAWKEKTIVDVEKYHKGKMALFELDKEKTRGPLVVIDPVEALRNAAAAVSSEKYKIIIKRAKAFLKKPSKEFFVIKTIDEKELLKKAKDNFLFIFEASSKKGKEDVVGGRLLKVFNHIKKQFETHDFTLKYSNWEWKKKAKFYFIVKKEILSKEKEIKGPPTNLKDFVKEFKKKHKKTTVKKKILYAKIKRRYTKPSELQKALVKDPYITQRTKTFEIK